MQSRRTSQSSRSLTDVKMNLTLPASLALIFAILPQTAMALSPSQVFDKVKDSIVVVNTLDAQGEPISRGSGVLLPSGQIATNCHVVKDGVIFQVGSGKNLMPATFYAGDEDKDICLLQAGKLAGTPAQLGKSTTLKVGEAVYAIGAPLGLELSLTDGIVSQLRGKPIPIIQTTAAISHGSSGGGLFNAQGQLVGFTTLKIKDEQGFNFAIPVEWLSNIKRHVSNAPEEALTVDNEEGGQREEAMSANVRSSLLRALADTAVTRTAFRNVADEAAWLKEMSRRLAKSMPDESERLEFLTTLHWEASRAGVDPQLMLGLIEIVSGFRKYAVSPKGARGYTQVMPFWVKAIGSPDHNLFQLRTNLRYGALILRHYIDIERGDLYSALGRYNGSLGHPDFPNLVVGAWKRAWDYVPVTSSDLFVVQLAALSDATKAEDLKARAAKAGLPAYTDKVGFLTRVRVGPFHSRAAAVAAAVKLSEQGMAGQILTE